MWVPCSSDVTLDEFLIKGHASLDQAGLSFGCQFLSDTNRNGLEIVRSSLTVVP